jgi:hypothetical protein
MLESTASRAVAVAVVLGLALTSAGNAKPKPNTLLLGDLGNGDKLWLMLDSVRQDEATVRHGWTVIDYAALQTTQDIHYRSDASKFYVKCKTQEIELANAIKFAGQMGGGANVFQVNAEPSPEPAAQDYHPVHPNTAEQVVANAICKQKIR